MIATTKPDQESKPVEAGAGCFLSAVIEVFYGGFILLLLAGMIGDLAYAAYLAVAVVGGCLVYLMRRSP